MVQKTAMPKRDNQLHQPPILDLQKLRYLIEIADHGSFTRASINLELAQSALSRHIHELEELFGQPLFHRTGRGVVATEFAQNILPRARHLLIQAQKFSDDVAAERGIVRGQVRLAVLRSLSDLILTPLLVEVSNRFPAIEMRVMEGLTDHVEEWLSTGRIDLGIVYDSPPGPGSNSEFLMSANQYLIGDKNNKITKSSTFSLQDLASLPLVLPALPNRLRAVVENACTVQGIKLQVLPELDSIQSIKDLVKMGGRYSILPLYAVRHELNSGALSAARIINPEISRQVFLKWSIHHPKSRASDEVAKILRRQMREHIRSGYLSEAANP